MDIAPSGNFPKAEVAAELDVVELELVDKWKPAWPFHKALREPRVDLTVGERGLGIKSLKVLAASSPSKAALPRLVAGWCASLMSLIRILWLGMPSGTRQ